MLLEQPPKALVGLRDVRVLAARSSWIEVAPKRHLFTIPHVQQFLTSSRYPRPYQAWATRPDSLPVRMRVPSLATIMRVSAGRSPRTQRAYTAGSWTDWGPSAQSLDGSGSARLRALPDPGCLLAQALLALAAHPGLRPSTSEPRAAGLSNLVRRRSRCLHKRRGLPVGRPHRLLVISSADATNV